MLKRLFASRKKPYFPTENKLETLTSDLSGTKLTFTCPRPSVPSALPYQKNLTEINIFDGSQYDYFDERNKNLLAHQRGDFPEFIFLKRDWGFWGSILDSSCLGPLGLTAVVNYVDSLPDTMTCFNPQHFEQVVIRSLYFVGGPGNIGNGKRTSPVNWKIHEINGREWIYCEIHKNSNPTAPRCHFYTPIDDQYFIQFCFNLVSFEPHAASLNLMKKIAKKIMETVQITLNKGCEERLIKVRNQYENVQYSTHRPHEKWKFYDFDDVLSKYCSYGSPLPKWKQPN